MVKKIFSALQILVLVAVCLVPLRSVNAATPPTFIQEAETAYNDTSPKTTSSFDVQAGDVLVAYVLAEHDNATNIDISDNTSGALTWTERELELEGSSNRAYLRMWTTTVDSNRSMTVTFTRTSVIFNLAFGGNVLTFRGSGGIGATNSTNNSTGSGAPSLNITTTQANSAIVVANADWNAVDGASRTWRTNAGAFTEQTYVLNSGAATFYGGYHADAGSIGTYAVGLTAPNSQRYVIGAIEVLGTTGGGGPPNAHNCPAGWTDIGGGQCRMILTTTGSNQTFTSPINWNNSSNTIECIGAGGSGGSAYNNTSGLKATGGGGGAYSSISNFVFAEPGVTTATYRVGAGGATTTLTTTGTSAGSAGEDSWWNSSSLPSPGTTNGFCAAKGGAGGTTGTSNPTQGAFGGLASDGHGQTRRDGGKGGGITGTNQTATGGGGAAGNSAIGGNAATTSMATAGNGGQANGSGAAGGTGVSSTAPTGGSGTPGTEYTSAGSGGGGGGARGSGSNSNNVTGGTGGPRGGGGGGALKIVTNAGATVSSGRGGDGVIIVTYSPGATPSRTLRLFGGMNIKLYNGTIKLYPQ